MPQHQRRSTDGGYGFAFARMLLQSLAQRSAGIQIGGSWQAARQHHQFHQAEIHLPERHIGLHRNAVRTTDHRGVIDGNCAYVQSGTAHDVNGCNGLYLLETSCEKYCNHIPYIL